MYIDIGTEVLPAIAFAFEEGEIDIMTRKPRLKKDHLINLRTISQSHGYIGFTEFWGALFCYYVVANDFGFIPAELFMKVNTLIIVPNDNDVYNPTAWNLGNTHLNSTSCSNPKQTVDWLYTKHALVDLRMSALNCHMINGRPIYTPSIKFGTCRVQQISPYTNRPVCFTTEGIKYAQSAYFYGTVVGQIFNAFCCKTRKASVFTQGLNNTFMLFAIST